MTDLTGKRILITGATDGIGQISAQHLAEMGAAVTIVGRNAEKTEKTAATIRQKSGNTQVDVLVGDLSLQSEVRRVATQFLERYDHLDVLLNNAGGVFMRREVTAEGLEKTFALNHMAYFTLTHLLLDLLKASPAGRVVNVSSGAHVGGKVNFGDLQLERGFSGWAAYSQSKMMNVLFTYELAQRLQGTNVTANTLHPGFVATNFGKSNGGIFRPLFGLFQAAAITPEEGAKTSIYLASSPEVNGVSGKYFDKQKAVRSAPLSYDEGVARRLWEVSLKISGIAEPQGYLQSSLT